MSESITEYRNHYDRRDLLAQWYVVKNGDLTPDKVTSGSQEKVWWRCTQGHEWTSAPYERAKRGTGCPYCAGKRIPPGMDLVSVYPYLAKQWSAEKTENWGLRRLCLEATAPYGGDAVTATNGKRSSASEPGRRNVVARFAGERHLVFIWNG